MNIAYFDLGFSKEQYGLNPTKYGGGAVVARYLKEEQDIDFTIFAPADSFKNLGSNERKDRCVILPQEVCEALKRGYPISHLTPFMSRFDLILHPHTCETLYRGDYKGPIVQFCGFDGDAGNPGNDYILFYDPSFYPKFGEKPKYVKIGKPVPSQWLGYKQREPMIFQCSRHDTFMNSIELAKRCINQGFKGIFAGPIHNNYPLMDYIDNKNTFYLGEIFEQEKMKLHAEAALCGLLHNWENLPFNQSIIEAQGQGTPIYVTNKGPFFNHYLRHKYNGFDANECSLWEAYSAADSDMSFASWKSASKFSVPEMILSFKKAFSEIIFEWKK